MLVVRFLDVGQGDATIIENGGSIVIVDGGPSPTRFGHLLDSLGLAHDTIDAVVLSHAHQDHLGGLRALFDSERGITVRYFFENRDAHTGVGLARLRDSVNARVQRGELVIRDTDDPCANGSALCTLTLRGGATLHVMRPLPGTSDVNDRSTPLKLVGPDSSFTMWMSGDAERDAIDYFDGADYDIRPGMRADVLKADHHGSCNGISARFLDLVQPRIALIGVGARNSYGHVHRQTKVMLARRGIGWYRTDRNGSITIRAPRGDAGGFAIAMERGRASEGGESDRTSRQPACDAM